MTRSGTTTNEFTGTSPAGHAKLAISSNGLISGTYTPTLSGTSFVVHGVRLHKKDAGGGVFITGTEAKLFKLVP